MGLFDRADVGFSADAADAVERFFASIDGLRAEFFEPFDGDGDAANFFSCGFDEEVSGEVGEFRVELVGPRSNGVAEASDGSCIGDAGSGAADLWDLGADCFEDGVRFDGSFSVDHQA